jgi:hypothetical protein
MSRLFRLFLQEEYMSPRKQWKDLSGWQRLSVFVAVAIQISLLVAALADIRRRPAEQIRGRKGLWFLLSFVNYIGPSSYFLFGRKPAPQQLPPA